MELIIDKKVYDLNDIRMLTTNSISLKTKKVNYISVYTNEDRDVAFPDYSKDSQTNTNIKLINIYNRIAEKEPSKFIKLYNKIVNIDYIEKLFYYYDVKANTYKVDLVLSGNGKNTINVLSSKDHFDCIEFYKDVVKKIKATGNVKNLNNITNISL